MPERATRGRHARASDAGPTCPSERRGDGSVDRSTIQICGDPRIDNTERFGELDIGIDALSDGGDAAISTHPAFSAVDDANGIAKDSRPGDGRVAGDRP